MSGRDQVKKKKETKKWEDGYLDRLQRLGQSPFYVHIEYVSFLLFFFLDGYSAAAAAAGIDSFMMVMSRRGDGVLLLVDGGGRDGRQDHLMMMLVVMLVHGRRIGATAVVQLRVGRIGK